MEAFMKQVYHTTLGAGGRLVIPAGLRQSLHTELVVVCGASCLRVTICEASARRRESPEAMKAPAFHGVLDRFLTGRADVAEPPAAESPPRTAAPTASPPPDRPAGRGPSGLAVAAGTPCGSPALLPGLELGAVVRPHAFRQVNAEPPLDEWGALVGLLGPRPPPPWGLPPCLRAGCTACSGSTSCCS
jgi:hypothetical protein